MKCSAVGALVGCTTNTSWRRTFSSISTWTSPSENVETSALPGRTPSSRHTASASGRFRSEEHTSELQSLMRRSYAVFCLKKKNINLYTTSQQLHHNHISYPY